MNQRDLDQKTDRLLYQIWSLTGHFNALLSSCFEAECNLSLQEIKAVEFLGRTGPCKMKALSDYLKLAVSSTTTLVDNLEVKGAVRRERSVEDRRVVMLELTQEGMQDYEVTLAAYRQFCRGILMALPKTDQDHLLRIFERIKNAYGH